jgi:hypothetical protein
MGMNRTKDLPPLNLQSSCISVPTTERWEEIISHNDFERRIANRVSRLKRRGLL